MLTRNAQIFKGFLENQNIHLNFIEGEDGEVLIEINESLKSGPKVRLVVVFDNSDTMVSVYGFDYVMGINPSKKTYIFETVNALNLQYTYFKFCLDKENITMQSHALFNDNFDSDVIMRLIMGMLRAMDEEYPGIMRVIWS